MADLGASLPVPSPCSDVLGASHLSWLSTPSSHLHQEFGVPGAGLEEQEAGEVLLGLWAAPRPLQPPPRSRASDVPCSAVFRAGFPPAVPPSPICSRSGSPASPPAPFAGGGDAHIQLLREPWCSAVPTGPPAQPRVPLVLGIPAGLGSISFPQNPQLKGEPLPNETDRARSFMVKP